MMPFRVSLAVVITAFAARPQDPTPKPPRPTPAQAMAAVDRWLAAEDRPESGLDTAAGKLCASGTAAMEALADRIRRAPVENPRLRSGLDAILTRVGVRFFTEQGTRGVVFAGQYDPLLPLQPWIGQLYLTLLLDPPDWFPDTSRSRLVPALRDLFLRPPPAEDVRRIEALADDAAREPEVLRMQLSFALAQWGLGDRAKVLIRDLEQQCADPDPDARLYPLYFLADVHYQMRAYASAREAYRRYIELATERVHPLRPLDFYNATCCAALSGEVDQAVTWLQRAVELHAAAGTDPSLRLDRVLFDEDPEIEAVRRDPRFRALVRTAFPEGAGGGGR